MPLEHFLRYLCRMQEGILTHLHLRPKLDCPIDNVKGVPLQIDGRELFVDLVMLEM